MKNGESQCCYSPSGGLLTDASDGAGTRDCGGTGMANRLRLDVLPYIFCCKLNDDCGAYNAARPTISSESYVKPGLTAFIFGDSHIKTFDNVDFDFNGYGEYIAFCGKSTDTSFNLENCRPDSDTVLQRQGTTSVHFRLAQLEETHDGTVIVGVSVEDISFRRGLRPITVVTSINNRLDVYDGDNLVFFPPSGRGRMLQKRIDGVTIFKADRPDYSVRLTFKSGLMMRFRESEGAMTPSFLRRSSNSESYVGLLGVPDGDETNDFMNQNGTIVDMSGYRTPVIRRPST